MFKIRCIFVVLILGTSVTSAHAELICTVQKSGIVMKTGKSGEFYSLVGKKMFDEAARCCAACAVDPGTRVIITDHGFVKHTIRVLEGESRGCVGELPAEWVKNCG